MNNNQSCNRSILNRLKRIEGQIKGIQKMIAEGDTECNNIINQMSAVRSGINNVMGLMMAENLSNIIENKDMPNYDDELDKAIQLIVKK